MNAISLLSIDETYIKLLNYLEQVGILCDETKEDIDLRDYNIDSFCSLVAVANYIDEVKKT